MVYRFFKKSAKNMFGSTAGAVAADGFLGMLLQGHNNRVQRKQQGKLLEQQLGFDKRKMDYAQELGLKLWDKTNYAAQVEQMKKAGLSTGLMYGMSGAGGATTGGGAQGVNSAAAASGGGEIMGMQMLQAQRDLIEAQTQKTEAEAEKIEGVDTQEAKTRIESLTQGIKNQKAVERLTKFQIDLTEIETLVKEGSYNDVLSSIHYNARILHKELGILANEKEISDETKNEKIALVQGELIGLGLANELKRKEADLTDKKIEEITANIAQRWKDLSLKERKLIIDEFNSETARKNYNLSLREYFEKVRKTDYDMEMRTRILNFQKDINDMSDSEKMTMREWSNIFNSATR